PDKYEEVRRHASLPVSTNSVFHTMLDIADIDADALDLHYSLASDVFKVRDRMYLGDHDDPVPFWQIGLKKQDFEMLDKWKIVYDKDGF
ncbi:MAG: hypothetical protein PHG27_06810, partial [Massilibacteroides sp.]|nr:hypothetical protein [Massilibacteroides sp.]